MLWLLLLLWRCEGCSDSVSAVSGLFIDFSGTGAGDGSECAPFQSFSPAFSAALLSPQSLLQLVPSGRAAWIAGELTISTTVTVDAAGSSISVAATVKVLPGAHLTLRSVRMASNSATLQVDGGLLSIQTAEVGESVVMEMNRGGLEISDSTFFGLKSRLIQFRAAQVAISRTRFVDCGDIFQVNLGGEFSSGKAALEEVEVERSGKLINCINAGGGNIHFILTNSTIRNNSNEILAGSFENINISIENATVLDSCSLLSGFLANSTVRVTNSHFQRSKARLIDIGGLQGLVSLSNCTFLDFAQGPLVQLVNNRYPFSEALVEISHCFILSMTYLNGTSLLFLGQSATVLVRDTEVRNCTVFSSGLFFATAASVTLRNVLYVDCVTQMSLLYDAVNSVVLLLDVSVLNIVTDDYFSSCTSGSSCVWRNVSIIDPVDYYPIFVYIFTWPGFQSTTAVYNSYFRTPPGPSQLTMGAVWNSDLLVQDCDFVGIETMETFAAFFNSKLTVRNITIMNFKGMSFVTCQESPECLVENVQFLGASSIELVLQGSRSRSVFEHIDFPKITETAMKITDFEAVFRRCTMRGLAGSLCKLCATAYLELDRFSLIDASAQILLQMSYSTFNWTQGEIKQILCDQLMLVDFTTVLISGVVLQEAQVISYGGLIEALYSSVSLESSQFADIQTSLSLEVGMIKVESSELSIVNCSFSHFNSSLITSLYAPSITIAHCYFGAGGYQAFNSTKRFLAYGGVLSSRWSAALSISDTEFVNVSADFGGAVYLRGTDSEYCSLQNVFAHGNEAVITGGFLYSEDVEIHVKNSRFFNNSAAIGGALATLGVRRPQLLSLQNSEFATNSAVQQGGAQYFSDVRVEVTNCSWTLNSALYGPDRASTLADVAIIQNGSVTVPEINTVSGWTVNRELRIACLDKLGQVISIDNSTKLELVTKEELSDIIVSVLLEARQGWFIIPSFVVIGTPGSIVTVNATVANSVSRVLFTARLRECRVGEYRDSLQCKECSHNTYSLNPSTPCTLCPDEADCIDGFQLLLHRGYWRASNMSTNIYQCVVPQACLGGMNSDCSHGYSGTMCSHCVHNYYKVNQLQCLSCGEVQAVRVALTLFIPLAGAVCTLYAAPPAQMTYFVIMDFLQTLYIQANFNLYWPSSLSHFLAVMGDLGSAGMTALSSFCFHAFPALAPVYSQVVVSIVFSLALLLSVPVICAVLKRLSKSVTRVATVRLTLLVFCTLLPMLLLIVLRLLPCAQVSGLKYLLYDSAVECWSALHTQWTVAVFVPVGVLACAVPALLLTAGFAMKRRRTEGSEQWVVSTLCVQLMRKYALMSILAFTHSAALPVQASTVLVVNTATEIAMSRLDGCKWLSFFRVYKATLVASTLFAFSCVLCASSHASEFHFAAISYLTFAFPLVAVVARLVKRRLKGKKVVYTSKVQSIEQDSNYHPPNVSIASSEVREMKPNCSYEDEIKE